MTSTTAIDLGDIVDRHFARCVQLRRYLHAHPEPSGMEYETTLHLYRLLGEEGFPVRQGKEGRGIIADIEQSAPRRIGLRADIDALRIHDQKQVAYRSQNDGVMHACGHDVHTAILFGALLVIRDLLQQEMVSWPISVRGIFQPAEETSQGALEMIETDAIKDVDAIVALHVDPSRACGKLGIREGVFTANCDEMLVTIQGRGGHGARPHETHDPICAAAHLIHSLYSHVPRVTDSQDSVVVSFGKIDGGHNSNVIPETVTLGGTVRTLDPVVRERTFDHIRRLADSIALATGTTIQVVRGVSAPSVVNDQEMTRMVAAVGGSVVGHERVETISRPSMGSEDFAHYLQHIPGVMFRLGTGPPDNDRSRPGLHTPEFDIDEEAIRIGMRVLSQFAVEWSRPPGSDSTDGRLTGPISSTAPG